MAREFLASSANEKAEQQRVATNIKNIQKHQKTTWQLHPNPVHHRNALHAVHAMPCQSAPQRPWKWPTVSLRWHLCPCAAPVTCWPQQRRTKQCPPVLCRTVTLKPLSDTLTKHANFLCERSRCEAWPNRTRFDHSDSPTLICGLACGIPVKNAQ